ncbi:hypothetical protein Y032_0088g2146 [Ancylostoma ceylanicum]|nr:hypothetical protein Y032_0088g2146 [Ancylostoma ceylanicum]
MSLFVQGMTVNEVKRLSSFLEAYRHDTYAASHSIAKINRIHSPVLVVSNELEWMFDPTDRYRPIDEGERYVLDLGSISRALKRLVATLPSKSDALRQVSSADLDILIKEAVLSLQFDCSDKYFNDNITIPAKNLWAMEIGKGWRANEGDAFGGYKLCMPEPYSKAVPKAEAQIKRSESYGEVTNRVISINEILGSTYNSVSTLASRSTLLKRKENNREKK